MATSIGNLAVKISANGSQATAEMDRVRKSIREIDQEAKRGGGANWIQTRMGLTGSSSMAEMKAYRAEQLAAARTGRQAFDAQIGGGSAVASMSKFKGGLSNATAGFADLTAKAWAAKEAIHMAFSAGSSVVRAFRGDVAGAQDALAKMPTTGWLNEYGRIAGEWISDTFVERDVYKNRDAMLAEAEQNKRRQDADKARAQKAADEKRRQEEMSAETRRMSQESLLINADPFTADKIRMQMYQADQMGALKRSGIDPGSKAYIERQAIIRATLSSMEIKAYKEQEERERAHAEAQRAQQEQAAQEQAAKAKEAADEKLRRADELRSIDADIQAKTLAMQGKTNEAELVMIREKYRSKIDEARRAGDAELATKLAQQQRLDEAEVMRQRGGSLVQIKRDYTYLEGSPGDRSGGRNRPGGPGPAGGEAREPVRISKGDPEQTGYMRRMADRLDHGVLARAG